MLLHLEILQLVKKRIHKQCCFICSVVKRWHVFLSKLKIRAGSGISWSTDSAKLGILKRIQGEKLEERKASKSRMKSSMSTEAKDA